MVNNIKNEQNIFLKAVGIGQPVMDNITEIRKTSRASPNSFWNSSLCRFSIQGGKKYNPRGKLIGET